MSKPSISKEKDTPEAAEVVDLLREAGEERRAFGRELARRLTMPPAELAAELLREGGAS